MISAECRESCSFCKTEWRTLVRHSVDQDRRGESAFPPPVIYSVSPSALPPVDRAERLAVEILRLGLHRHGCGDVLRGAAFFIELQGRQDGISICEIPCDLGGAVSNVLEVSLGGVTTDVIVNDGGLNEHE